jgi:hypothetical protein
MDGDKALSNIDIDKYVKVLKIKNFRGCYMRDELKNLKSNNIECGVLNLNLSKEPGSHWTCWYKTKTKKYYFNSFGLPPPKELVDYLGSPILYSTFQLQGMNDQNCGKWCLFVLKKLNEGSDYIDLILSFVQ